jgi:hypothetical protein
VRTLRITLIFAVLALGLSFVLTLLYAALKPTSSVLDVGVGVTANDPIPTLIPIACGLLVAPFTLRINRWIERRMQK